MAADGGAAADAGMAAAVLEGWRWGDRVALLTIGLVVLLAVLLATSPLLFDHRVRGHQGGGSDGHLAGCERSPARDRAR